MTSYLHTCRTAVISALLTIGLSGTVYSQTCESGKLDERVATFLKSLGPEPTLTDLKAKPIDQIKNDGPKTFKALHADSVKRIKITADNIGVNVVNASGKTGLPVIINYHGGGFMIPLQPWMEYDAMVMSRAFGAVVFDIDYRVSPAHKFPTAANDAYAAFQWVVDHAKEFGGDPSRVILNGTSAGANLAALVVHRAKKDNRLSPVRLMMLNCPPMDNPMTSYYDSYETNARGYLITKDLSLYYLENYLDKTEWYRENATMWPIHEKDFSGLPSALVVTAEFDILRDEGIAYAKKLESAGNNVRIMCFPHQLHCLIGLPPDAAERKELLKIMKESVEAALKTK